MNKIINIGLIGCGVVGLKRISNLPKNFNLIACADPKILSIKKKIHIKNILLTKNWNELIHLKNLHAVIIATTHSLHSTIIKACITKNIHAFVEKPAGTSAIETKKMILLLKSKNFLAIRVGFNHRYHPSFMLAKKLIKENKIGDLMYIRAVYGHGGRLNYNKEWRFNKKLSGGGELIDKGSHLIDLSRFFLGNLKTDKHKLKTTFWNMKLEDNCFLILKNKKDNIAFLHASCTEWKNKFTFEIFGKFGKIEINGLGRSYGKENLIFYKMSKKMGIPKKKQYIFNMTKDHSWKLELEDFYIDIVKRRKPTPSIIDAYENLKIINRIYKNK
jgi:predicted dehydrogenase